MLQSTPWLQLTRSLSLDAFAARPRQGFRDSAIRASPPHLSPFEVLQRYAKDGLHFIDQVTSDSSILEEVSGLAEMKAAMSGPWTAPHSTFPQILGILPSEGWTETWKPSMSLTTSSMQECYWMADNPEALNRIWSVFQSYEGRTMFTKRVASLRPPERERWTAQRKEGIQRSLSAPFGVMCYADV